MDFCEEMRRKIQGNAVTFFKNSKIICDDHCMVLCTIFYTSQYFPKKRIQIAGKYRKIAFFIFNFLIVNISII